MTFVLNAHRVKVQYKSHFLVHISELPSVPYLSNVLKIINEKKKN